MPFVFETRWRRTSATAVVAVIASGLALLTAPPAGAAAAEPTAEIQLSATALLGDEVAFSVSFDNTAPNGAGYGPYVDLWMPASGIDGAGDEAAPQPPAPRAPRRGTPPDADAPPVTGCAAGRPRQTFEAASHFLQEDVGAELARATVDLVAATP